MSRLALSLPIAHLVLVAILLAAPAGAGPLEVSAGLFHGLDEARTGYILGFEGRLLGRDEFQLGVSAGYARTAGDETQAVTAAGLAGTVVVEDRVVRHTLPAFLTARLHLGDRLPYLRAGVGWLTVRSSHDNLAGSPTRTFHGPAYEVGLGFDLGRRLFVEGSWQDGSLESGGDEPRAGSPPGEEIDPSALVARVGFRFP